MSTFELHSAIKSSFRNYIEHIVSFNALLLKLLLRLQRPEKEIY